MKKQKIIEPKIEIWDSRGYEYCENDHVHRGMNCITRNQKILNNKLDKIISIYDVFMSALKP